MTLDLFVLFYLAKFWILDLLDMISKTTPPPHTHISYGTAGSREGCLSYVNFFKLIVFLHKIIKANIIQQDYCTEYGVGYRMPRWL